MYQNQSRENLKLLVIIFYKNIRVLQNTTWIPMISDHKTNGELSILKRKYNKLKLENQLLKNQLIQLQNSKRHREEKEEKKAKILSTLNNINIPKNTQENINFKIFDTQSEYSILSNIHNSQSYNNISISNQSTFESIKKYPLKMFLHLQKYQMSEVTNENELKFYKNHVFIENNQVTLDWFIDEK